MPPTGGIHPAPQQGPKRQENAYRWAPEHPMLWATSWLTAQIIQRQLLSSQAAQISAPNFLSRTSVLVGHHYKPSPPHTMLTGIKTAEDPGMVGLGRVPGMEAGMGCLCLLWRWSRDDREPGTGLGTKRKKNHIIPDGLGLLLPSFQNQWGHQHHGQTDRILSCESHIIEDIREIITNKIHAWFPLLLPS